jgi:type IV pilus assembly protein PilE
VLKRLRDSNTGFTLVELMIVVVIVGVLTMVAYPAYQGFVAKAKRGETQSYLMHVAQAQHLYFNDARTYAETAAELNVEASERVGNNYLITFTITTTTPPPTFSITATPVTGTTQANDGILSINNTGEKTHKGVAW